MEFTDKDLHCMARVLQSHIRGDDVECMYCKYANECGDEFMKTGKLHRYEVMPEKLQKLTGVHVWDINMTNQPKSILKASWIEEHPDLMDKLSKLSLKEQQDILGDPDTPRDEHNTGKENEDNTKNNHGSDVDRRCKAHRKGS